MHNSKDDVFGIITVVMSTISIGTGIFTQLEDWSLFDSFYYCIMVSLTTGYGDVFPKTDIGKFITILYSLISVNLFRKLILSIKGYITTKS